jgi:N-acetyl-beta-hexosaminidase
VNISVLNPCNFAINLNTPASFDKDSFAYVNSTVQWYLDKYIFFKGKACPGPQENSTLLNLTALNIEITSNDKLMPDDLLKTNESYELTVDMENITIVAPQWSGVVRGLSTLAQLIKPPKLVDLYYTMAYAPLKLSDFPRYPYRGLMLDTARRYYSVDSILQILDAMHIAKFNVFHWHLVEDESFPLELKTF